MEVFMVASLLITLREGLEAALLIGIILGYLKRIGAETHIKWVWNGVGLGVAASLVSAYLFQFVAGGFSGRTEEVFEGLIMLFAVVILTYMMYWMHTQSRDIESIMEQRIQLAIGQRKLYGLVSLAFFSVYREGIELVLFLSATIQKTSAQGALAGSAIGLALAIALGYALFRTSTKLNLQSFFRITTLLIIFIAAGLFSYGIHELQEAAVIPIIIEHIYDINEFIYDKGAIGGILNAMFGYNGNPSLIEMLSYIGYLGITLKLFFLNGRTRHIEQ
jgi:high-affinity iron transporter